MSNINLTNENDGSGIVIKHATFLWAIREQWDRNTDQTFPVPEGSPIEINLEIGLYSNPTRTTISEEDALDVLGCYSGIGVAKYTWCATETRAPGYGINFYTLGWKKIKDEWKVGMVEKIGSYFPARAGEDPNQPQRIELREVKWAEGGHKVRHHNRTTKNGDVVLAENNLVMISPAKERSIPALNIVRGAIMRAALKAVQEDNAVSKALEAMIEAKKARATTTNGTNTAIAAPTAADAKSSTRKRGRNAFSAS